VHSYYNKWRYFSIYLNVIIGLFIGFVLLIDIVPAVASDPLDSWHWRNPLPQGNSLNSMATDSVIIVAVGDGGTVLTSADGINWAIQTTGLQNNLIDVVYGNGKFIAIDSTGNVIASNNGQSWTIQHSFNSTNLQKIRYLNGSYVVLENDTTPMHIYTSQDGVTWTEFALKTMYNGELVLCDIAYANGNYVAVGQYFDKIGGITTKIGPAIIFTNLLSGSSWWDVWKLTGSSILHEVTVGNGIFVAVGEGPTAASDDGQIWHQQDVASNFSSVSSIYRQFAAVGNNGVIYSSSDALRLTSRTSGTTAFLKKIISLNGQYIACGSSGTILTSSNGVDWTLRSRGTIDSFFNITYANGQFMAAGSNANASNGTIVTSIDGVQWNTVYSLTNSQFQAVQFYDVKYVNGTWLASGNYGLIAKSNDGAVWSVQSSGTAEHVRGTAYGNNKFVALLNNGTFLISSDASSWALNNPNISGLSMNSIVYSNEIFVAVGNAILTSTDGNNWVKNSTTITNSLSKIKYLVGKFVAVGDGGVVMSSIDGTNWIVERTATSDISGFTDITYGNGKYVVAGTDNLQRGIIYSSAGLSTWYKRNNNNKTEYLFGIAFANDRFVAVGSNGTVIQTDPSPPPCTSVQLSAANQTVSDIASTGTVGVTASFCEWLPVSSASWLGITSGGYYSENSDVSFSVEANNGVARSASITIADQIFTVNQAASNQYIVTLTTGNNYTISPATQQSININATTSFTVTPAAGYGVVMTGCGGSLTGSTYTTGVITGDCSISVTAVARNANSADSSQPPTISDALKALQDVVGITQLTQTEKVRYDVAPLSATGTPLGNGAIDSADVILILRRSIGIGNW
jgi:hypothetical protein